MPKINRNDYKQTEYGTGGGFKQFQPGAYVGVIQAIRTTWEEMDWNIGQRVQRNSDDECAVMVVFDIAEGEFAGEFSRDFYMADNAPDPSKDFMHWVKYSWADLRDLKRFDDALKASNPGFDPEAAFDADKWELYIGKKFGFVADGTVKTNDQGYDQWRTNVKPWKVCSADAVRNGEHPEPRITDKRTKVDDAASPYNDESIPF